MTFSLLKAQALLKARQHKYTHRKLIGRDPKTNRKRYRYYYAEHHGGGITSAEIEAGSAFKLTFKGRRGHFHVQSVEGDTVTVRHDGRPNSKPVEMTKAEFRALLKRQHETVENKKREKAQENRRRGRKKRKGSKRTKRKTATPQTQAPEQTPQVQDPEQGADNFETMPESTGTPLKADGSLDLEKMTPDQVKEHLKYQAHVGLQVLTKSPEFQDLLKEAQRERERGKRAKRGSAQDRLNNAVSDIYGPSKIVPREQISEALGFKVVMTGDVYRAFEAGTAEEIMNAFAVDELGRKFGLGEDEPPVPYSNWLKQVKEVEQEAYKREDQRALVALKGASVGDVITYQNIPFEVRTIEEHQYRGTIYGVRLSDPKTHTPKRAPVSATFDVKGDQLRFENQPVDEKGIRFYEGDFDRGIDPNTYGENMKGAEGEFEYAWRTQTREEALKTPYEIPADKIPASLKTEQGADNLETMPEPDPSPAREQLTETAREVETPPVKKKRARKPKKFGSSIPSKDELLEEFKGITESYEIGNKGNPVLSQVFKVLNSPNTTKEQKKKFKRGLNLPLLNLNDPFQVENYLSERETRTGRGSDLFLPSALKVHGTSLDPFNVSEQAQEETGKVYNLYSSPSATNEESGLAFAFGTIKAEGVKPKRGLWAIHRDSGRHALVDDTVKPHQAPAILTFLGEELKDQLAKVDPDNPEHLKIFARATRSVSLARQQRQADLAEMLARILNDPRLNKSLIGLNLLDLYKALRC